MAWLDGWDRVPNARSSGGTYVPGAPLRISLHGTEVMPSTVSGAYALTRRHEYPPHLWYGWVPTGWAGTTELVRIQSVPLTRSAFALEHRREDPHTNKQGALQVELWGFAAQFDTWPDERLKAVARDVIVPLCEYAESVGSPIDLDQVHTVPGVHGYGYGSPLRMSWSEWAGYRGVHAHLDVPGNRHWDTGTLDVPRIAALAREMMMALSADDKKWLTTLVNEVVAAELHDTRAWIRSEVSRQLGVTLDADKRPVRSTAEMVEHVDATVRATAEVLADQIEGIARSDAAATADATVARISDVWNAGR